MQAFAAIELGSTGNYVGLSAVGHETQINGYIAEKKAGVTFPQTTVDRSDGGFDVFDGGLVWSLVKANCQTI